MTSSPDEPEYLTAQRLAEYAADYERFDPIEWGEMAIKEDDAFLMMATSILDMATRVPEDERLIVAMACATKLLVENFVLQFQLMQCTFSKKG